MIFDQGQALITNVTPAEIRGSQTILLADGASLHGYHSFGFIFEKQSFSFVFSIIIDNIVIN